MAKKFDLGAYTTDTPKTQPAHNKYTRYLENEIESPRPAAKSGGVSEGSDKAPKRINMAFNDRNYALIMNETERLGISCVYMINKLAEAMDPEDMKSYLDSMKIRRSKDNIPRRKGRPLKRINLKFSPEVYEKISAGAAAENLTITQYINISLEIYATENSGAGE